jgi:hypothetical protein
MTTKTNLVTDVLFFLKDLISDNITDPIQGSRGGSSFVMTSYPQKETRYPLITLKCSNIEAKRSGMQTTLQDIRLTLEIRIWARNEKEKDNLYNQILNLLASNQFTVSGSNANNLYNLNISSGTEIDEPGEQGIKSRIIQLNYFFYDA